MCTQSLPDAMLQKLDSQSDSVLTVAAAAVLERSPEGPPKEKTDCDGAMKAGMKAAVTPGLQLKSGSTQPLPSLLRSLKQRAAAQKAVPAGKLVKEQHPQLQPQPPPQLHQQQQPQQPAGGRVQMVARAVEEAMRAGLLPAGLGESFEGETLTTRILNNFHAAQMAEVAEGEKSCTKRGPGSEALTPTTSTCTSDSPMQRSPSTELDSASSHGGEQVVRETASQDGHLKERFQTGHKNKGAARNKAMQRSSGRALPLWLSNQPSVSDACNDCAAEQSQKHVWSPNRSGLCRDKLRARGRQSLDAMEAVQGPQPLSLDVLRAKGHNVLVGVGKQQQSTQEQIYTMPASPTQPMAVERAPINMDLMPSPAFNAAPLPMQISDNAPLMGAPPPGLSPWAQPGDATCAYLLSGKREQAVPHGASGQRPDDEPPLFLPRPFSSALQQEGMTSKEGVLYIDTVYNRFDDEFLPMVGSMGTQCTVEFGDEPLKIDFASLESMQLRT